MPDTGSARRTAEALRNAVGHRPVRIIEAHTIVTDRALRTAVSRGTVARLGRGVVAVPATTDVGRYRQRIGAALLRRPHAAAGLVSALACVDCSLPYFGHLWNHEPVHLIATSGKPCRSPELVIARWPLPAAHVIDTPWGPATSPLRTAVDMARSCDLPSALIAADECCALHLAMTAGHPPELRRVRDGTRLLRHLVADQSDTARALMVATLAGAALRYGNHRVEKVAQWVDPAAESPGESLSRALLLLAGLPRPVVGLPVIGDDGRHYVADLAWPQQRLLGEVDGDGKYRAEPWEAFRREKHREDALRARGWRFVRWTVGEMLRSPGAVVARVERALAQPTSAPTAVSR